MLTLAAALSVQSPFTNNAFKDSDCVAARRNLDSDHGDPITLLNAYREWLEVPFGPLSIAPMIYALCICGYSLTYSRFVVGIWL